MSRIILRGAGRQERVKERQENARKERVKKAKQSAAARKKGKSSRAEYFKARRERIKCDPEQYEKMKQVERERWHRRKNDGKVKTVGEMTRREKKAVRETRKASAAKYYLKKKEAKQKRKSTNEDQQEVKFNESRQKATGRKKIEKK